MPALGPSSAALLDVSGLSVSFGGIPALADVSFEVGRGELLGLIGPNGAGKTTVLNLISRQYQPTRGRVIFDGTDVLSLRPHQVIGLGIVRTFQNLALCPGMSIRRNVMLGGFRQHRRGVLAEWLQLPSAVAAAGQLASQADLALERVGLIDRAEEPVGSLSHGTKRKVELARALCAQPRLLMLDEPASGLTDEETEDLVDLLRKLRASLDLAIIIIEHHLDMVLALSDRVVVLDMGQAIAEGPPTEVVKDPAVVEAYIGAA